MSIWIFALISSTNIANSRTGAKYTLGLTAFAVAVGTVLGLVGALCRLANFEKGNIVLRALSWVLRTVSLLYVTLFRGTPLFVQIFIWHFIWSVALINPADGWIISAIWHASCAKNTVP